MMTNTHRVLNFAKIVMKLNVMQCSQKIIAKKDKKAQYPYTHAIFAIFAILVENVFPLIFINFRNDEKICFAFGNFFETFISNYI